MEEVWKNRKCRLKERRRKKREEVKERQRHNRKVKERRRKNGEVIKEGKESSAVEQYKRGTGYEEKVKDRNRRKYK